MIPCFNPFIFKNFLKKFLIFYILISIFHNKKKKISSISELIKHIQNNFVPYYDNCFYCYSSLHLIDRYSALRLTHEIYPVEALREDWRKHVKVNFHFVKCVGIIFGRYPRYSVKDLIVQTVKLLSWDDSLFPNQLKMSSDR